MIRFVYWDFKTGGILHYLCSNFIFNKSKMFAKLWQQLWAYKYFFLSRMIIPEILETVIFPFSWQHGWHITTTADACFLFFLCVCYHHSDTEITNVFRGRSCHVETLLVRCGNSISYTLQFHSMMGMLRSYNVLMKLNKISIGFLL